MKKPKPTRAVADSMRQAAAMLGADISALKAAKSAGCPGFVGSRIHVDDVREWLSNAPEVTMDGSDLPQKDILERQRLREQVRKYAFANAVDAKLYVLVTEVNADITRIAHAIRTQVGTIEQLGPTWSGLDPCAIELKAKAFFRETCELFNDATSALYQTHE